MGDESSDRRVHPGWRAHAAWRKGDTTPERPWFRAANTPLAPTAACAFAQSGHIGYTVSMSLNVIEGQSTGSGADARAGQEDARAGQEAPADAGPGDARRPVSDELLDELTAWPPRDRAGMFRNWHRGALSLIQLNVVAVLEAEGPLPMSRLADELDVSVASATGIVDRMERRGLVQRRHATDDRRVVAVHLTEQSAGVFRDIAARRREHLARMLGELTEEELAGFLRGIRAIRAARQRLVGPDVPGTAQGPDTASGCGPAGGAPEPRTVESRDSDR